MLSRVTLVGMTPGLCVRAALLEPVAVRSLDALQLAAALDLGDELESFVTNDRQLDRAAGLADPITFAQR